LSPAARLSVKVEASGGRRALLDGAAAGIKRLAGVDAWTFVERPPHDDEPHGRVPVGEADLYIPLMGLIDLDEERDRLQRERDKASGELSRAEGKLANTGFVAKAPAEVVEAERQKAADWKAAIERLTSQIADLS
jgi:valyl-tRNA synthetase